MKRSKIFFCALLVFSITAAAFVIGANAAENVSVWDGSDNPDQFYSSASTLYIDSADDLCSFARTGRDFAGKTIVLRCDIIWSAGDASEWSEISSPENVWTPIGSSYTPFKGTFDGNGHTISGLYYYGNGDGVGFFGYVNGATIKDLHIINSYFNGDRYIGSIVGKGNGAVTITGCSSDAYIFSHYKAKDNHFAGGICGYLDGGTTYAEKISDCAFTGSITSDDGCNIGGIAGAVNGNSSSSISRCLATGTYTARNRAGGIIGRSYNGDITISDCYANVDLVTWGTANQGGIIGGQRTTNTNNIPMLSVYGCYYNGNNLHASIDSTGKFASCPTRLGNYEVDSTYTYGSIGTSSTYYTDSENDNSYETQGNQAALPESVKKLGGLSEFLAAKTCFEKNIYGDVALNTLKCADHDCSIHAGKWISDPSTGGQKALCRVPGCGTVLKRNGAIRITDVSVRLNSPAGIRFCTEVDKNAFYKSHCKSGDYSFSGSDLTFGTLIAFSDELAGELTVNSANCVNVEARTLVYEDGNKLCYTAAMSGFSGNIENYSRKVTVRSYMKYTEGDKTVYEYSTGEECTYLEVAEKLYDLDDITSAAKSKLNLMIALGSIDDGFFSEDPNRVLVLEDASKDLFDKFAAALSAEGFTKHTNYEYAGNSFGMYYNDDFVVTFYYTPKSVGKYTELNQDWYKPGHYIDDMNVIQKAVFVDDAYNVMRVIVEKRSTVDIPDTIAENVYEDAGIKNTIAYAFPNDNYNYYGMGYIIQLVDGSFIIIDGGRNVDDPRDNTDKYDSDYIMEYLLAHYPSDTQDKPVIAAWIFTHVHSDHTNAATAFAAKYHDDVVLEQVIYNFMSGDTAVPVGVRDQERWGENFLGSYFPDAKICKAHTGYRFYVRNAEIQIMCSMDDITPESWETMFSNNESCAFRITIDGAQKLMFTGEVFISGSRALVNMYGEELRSDVVQISHHGNFGATLELNKLIWPEDQDYTSPLRFALLPNGNNKQARDRLSLAENTPFVNNLGENLNGKLKKIFINGDLIFESGAITSGYRTKQSDANVVKSGAIGTWKILPLVTRVDEDMIILWPEDWN